MEVQYTGVTNYDLQKTNNNNEEVQLNQVDSTTKQLSNNIFVKRNTVSECLTLAEKVENLTKTEIGATQLANVISAIQEKFSISLNVFFNQIQVLPNLISLLPCERIGENTDNLLVNESDLLILTMGKIQHPFAKYQTEVLKELERIFNRVPINQFKKKLKLYQKLYQDQAQVIKLNKSLCEAKQNTAEERVDKDKYNYKIEANQLKVIRLIYGKKIENSVQKAMLELHKRTEIITPLSSRLIKAKKDLDELIDSYVLEYDKFADHCARRLHPDDWGYAAKTGYMGFSGYHKTHYNYIEKNLQFIDGCLCTIENAQPYQKKDKKKESNDPHAKHLLIGDEALSKFYQEKNENQLIESNSDSLTQEEEVIEQKQAANESQKISIPENLQEEIDPLLERVKNLSTQEAKEIAALLTSLSKKCILPEADIIKMISSLPEMIDNMPSEKVREYKDQILLGDMKNSIEKMNDNIKLYKSLRSDMITIYLSKLAKDKKFDFEDELISFKKFYTELSLKFVTETDNCKELKKKTNSRIEKDDEKTSILEDFLKLLKLIYGEQIGSINEALKNIRKQTEEIKKYEVILEATKMEMEVAQTAYRRKWDWWYYLCAYKLDPTSKLASADFYGSYKWGGYKFIDAPNRYIDKFPQPFDNATTIPTNNQVINVEQDTLKISGEFSDNDREYSEEFTDEKDKTGTKEKDGPPTGKPPEFIENKNQQKKTIEIFGENYDYEINDHNQPTSVEKDSLYPELFLGTGDVEKDFNTMLRNTPQKKSNTDNATSEPKIENPDETNNASGQLI